MQIAELCNGSTADSDSVCWGSNPYSAAKTKAHHKVCFLFCWRRIPRDSNKEGEPKARKKTVRWTVFADGGKPPCGAKSR